MELEKEVWTRDVDSILEPSAMEMPNESMEMDGIAQGVDIRENA